MRLLKIRAKQITFFGDIWIYRTKPLDRDEEGDMELSLTSDEEGFVGGNPKPISSSAVPEPPEMPTEDLSPTEPGDEYASELDS